MKFFSTPRVFCLFLAVFAVSGLLRGQNQQQDIQFRLAQSYERGGDMEAAARIYEQVYAKDSNNVVVFDALRRAYMQLKKYPEAATIMNARLARQPNDIPLLAQLGRVYSFLSDEPKARDAWDRAIAVAPKNEMSYRIVAGAMGESRLFDKAIGVYRQARKAIGKPGLFAADLAYLYGATMNYPDAVKEYLNMVDGDPNQFGLVQARLSAVTDRPEGLKAALAETQERLKKDSQNESWLMLLSWLYMEGRQYDAAFDIERRLDEKRKSGGIQIYMFAERALHDHANAAAMRAYQEVITKYPGFNMLPQAKFGYARTLEDSSAAMDTLKLFKGGNGVAGIPATESEPAFKGAIAAYRGIVNEYPKTEIAARSLLQVARMMFDRYFNLDEARASLDAVRTQYAGFIPVVMEAELLLGEVMLADGDLDKSETCYNRLLAFRTVGREMQEKARFRLAELAYFRGHFSEAVAGLQDLTKNAADNITNDALELLLFVQENQKADSVALQQFAKADLLQRQHRLSEALKADEVIRDKYRETPLIDEALMNIGDLYANMGRYADAAAAYDSLLTGFPESIVLDRAVMKLARIYQRGLHDTPKAIDAYQQLLVKYPNSIYASEARKAIRELRGDSL